MFRLTSKVLRAIWVTDREEDGEEAGEGEGDIDAH